MPGIIPDKLFLTSNLRFWQHDAIERFGRPFKNIYEMNKGMIERWNDTIGDGDLVFVLGNFALARMRTIWDMTMQLRGLKTIVMGDIDRGEPREWVKHGWQAAMRHSLLLDEAKIVLSYRPLMSCDNFNFYGCPSAAGSRPNHLCVSADDWEFRPVRLSEMLAGVGGIKGPEDRRKVIRKN